MDPVSGPLEPWVDEELMLSSYHKAIKRMLKVEVVEWMFIEEMGYCVMVAELSRTIRGKVKVEEKQELVRCRLEAEMKKNVELLSSVNKLAEEKLGLSVDLSAAQSVLGEAKQKIEAFASELQNATMMR
ncbi:hypothetical protein L3X38_042663 [Prunus dulcis]|uniref:Uncharacterized protein n=1 Tax=Prunus dulcis TaxID=3755 RepID=A0AAD4UXC1_PRUDU|nr:hypothetical protein L3X38_042663 [Prunus dulcis]